MPCAICRTRRERRFCPAVHDRICAVCCGTEREVTLDCPSDCVYLQQARQHERARPVEEADQAALFPQVEVREQLLYEREPLLVGLSYGLTNAARADRLVRDRDVLEALAQLATAYERLTNSGLVYEPANANPVQQAVAEELRKMIAEYRELEERHTGRATLRDSEVLQALVFLIRLGHACTSGRPKSRAFLDALAQKFAQKSGGIVGPETMSRIVVP